jgi:hypothetical protein
MAKSRNLFVPSSSLSILALSSVQGIQFAQPFPISTSRRFTCHLWFQSAATWIRFDIAFPVSQLARFCASTGPNQWAALHHLMEYLQRLPSLQFTYCLRKGAALLPGFADSDWRISSSSWSASGNLMLYNEFPNMWQSKMQMTTALSTAEAEYLLASAAGVDVLYLCNLLQRLGFAQGVPTPVYEDNTACIEWGNNVFGGRERPSNTLALVHQTRAGQVHCHQKAPGDPEWQHAARARRHGVQARDVSDMPWGCPQLCVAAVSQKLLSYNITAF